MLQHYAQHVALFFASIHQMHSWCNAFSDILLLSFVCIVVAYVFPRAVRAKACDAEILKQCHFVSCSSHFKHAIVPIKQALVVEDASV